jgi:hypothetical protein
MLKHTDMAEVLFYHLTESTLQDALPGLLERSLGRGWRISGAFAMIPSWRTAPTASRIPATSRCS